MKPVFVLGNGQLGRMLCQAGDLLGINVYPVGINDTFDTILYQQSIITAEIEIWPDTPLICELARQTSFINRDIFIQLTDRLTQKKTIRFFIFDNCPLETPHSPNKMAKIIYRVR